MRPMKYRFLFLFGVIAVGAVLSVSAIWPAVREPDGAAITINTAMAAPRWAQLERQLLAENVPAAREFFRKYFDDRGRLQAILRWGADDGPDDAFENFNHWPELHAMGASDEISRLRKSCGRPGQL